MSSGSPSQTVQLVGGPARRSPSRRHTGWPSSLPCRSWNAASSAARAANSRARQPLDHLLERERVVAEQRRRAPRRTRSADSRRLVVARRSAAASPKPETPECRSSTTSDSAVSLDSREMTNVSASSSVTIRAETSTGAEATLPLALPGARSSGDRARASGARGRRFDSCLAHYREPRLNSLLNPAAPRDLPV